MTRQVPSGAIGYCALGVALLSNALFYPAVVPGARALFESKSETSAALEARDYRAAEQSAERSYRLASTFGSNSVTAREAAALLVRARVLNGHGLGTRELAERTLAGDESAVGPSALPLVNSLQALGDVYASTGDSDLAIREYERALQLAEHLALPMAGRTTLLDALGHALFQSGEYDRAGAAYDRLIALLNRQEASNVPLLASALDGKANVLMQQADYSGARPLLAHAYSLVSDGAATPETARVLDSLGSLARFEGRIGEAEEYFRRAVEVAERVLGREHPALTEYLGDLSGARSSEGYLADARSMQERALAIAQRGLGAASLARIWILNDLGNTLTLQGDYVGARELYEEALRSMNSRFGPAHLYAAAPLYNLALACGHLGDYDLAKGNLEKAILIWEQRLGAGHPYVARALGSLAEVLTAQGRFVEAKTLYERALSIRTNRLNADHREVAETMADFARTLALSGDVHRATLLSTSALDILKKSTPAPDRQYAQAMLIRAEVSLLDGEGEAAVQHYVRAVGDLQRVFGPLHPDVAAARAGLATALVRAGRFTEALREALSAERISREHTRLTSRSLAEHEALLYAGRRSRALDVALRIVSGAPTCLACASSALDAVVRSRALVLDEMAERHRAVMEGRAGDLGPLIESVTRAKERLAHLVVAGPDSDVPGAYPALLATARENEERAERALAVRSEAYRRELSRSRSGLAEVQSALPPESALVSFVRYSVDSTPQTGTAGALRDAYMAFIVGRNWLSVVPLESASVVDSAVKRWRHEAANSEAGTKSADAEERYRQAGTVLRRLIWDPVLPHLRGARYALIVPDGLLNLVSFASLPVPGGYLVEGRPTIHYLSAERDLVNSFPDDTSAPSLLAVGGPDFSAAGADGAIDSIAPTSTRGASPPTDRTRSCPGLDTLTFAPLPGATLEAQEVVEQWRHSGTSDPTPAHSSDRGTLDVRLLLGAQATEAAVKRWAPHHRVLHFATHGFFLGDVCLAPEAGSRGVGGLSGDTGGLSRWQSDPLLQSGLALAGANRHSGATAIEDGVLTAEEVSGLNLDGTEWAVLSACDTGMGTVATGEGVLGLRRAFQIAGVQTVIMSLWGADDEWSRRWMQALYAERLTNRLTTADAVRQASLAILKERRRARLSSHPFFWAGFVAAGNWH